MQMGNDFKLENKQKNECDENTRKSRTDLAPTVDFWSNFEQN